MTRPDTASHRHPRVTGYRSRRSSVSGGQQETWDRLWPQLGMQALGPEAPAEDLVLPACADCSTPRRGSAGPRRWCWRSEAEPEPRHWRWRRPNRISMWSPSRCTGAGWRSCSARSTREGVTNIRLVRGDGVDVLEHMFGPDSLTGVRVFFPDPWPKARHHKRRLLQAETLALIADRLRPGGVLHAATDHARYAEQIAECGDADALAAPSHRRRRTADLGGAADNQVRDEGARRGQCGRRTGLGEAATMITCAKSRGPA